MHFPETKVQPKQENFSTYPSCMKPVGFLPWTKDIIRVGVINSWSWLHT